MMTATIGIAGIHATIDDGLWTCDDPIMLQLLQGFTEEQYIGSDPNPDYTSARVAVERIGGKSGKVISFDETEYEEGVIY